MAVHAIRWLILIVRGTQNELLSAVGGRAMSFFLLLSRNRATLKQTQRIYVSINFVLSSWNLCCLWQCEKMNRIIFLSLLCIMKLWKGYVCAAPFHKTYLQSKMDPTRDLFMAESQPSVPLHRDAHSLSEGLSSLYCCCGYAQKKKKSVLHFV